MQDAPSIKGFEELLRPIDVSGPAFMIYAYMPQQNVPADLALSFLERLKKTEAARCAAYLTAIRMVGLKGFAPWEKWHMLDDAKPPKGLAKQADGTSHSLSDLGEFKNIGHKSRIYHLREGRLIVLLTAYEGKKEDKLTADAVNPAVYLRERFLKERESLLRKKAGRQTR